VIKIDKKKNYLIIAGVLLVVGFIAWDVLCGGNISNNGNGADAVRTELESVSDKQQSAIDGLTNIEAGLDDSQREAGAISEGLGDVADSIGTVEERINDSETRAKSSAELISESQSILSRVRERGKTGD
jgi:methyl-accepting chemotaxis protein